ncbi:hypothetical protein SAY87_026406 [Trapa incisa]|uniref:GH16 domain-containing protein n=1 Tax=Trapa incisa TaxID=236973 RepID=A0AAN7JJZ5_9MYRT|nr:hypothetical protein SAY87_026406 [Trapa incisa]
MSMHKNVKSLLEFLHTNVFTLMAKATESSSSISGSTPPRTSALTLSHLSLTFKMTNFFPFFSGLYCSLCVDATPIREFTNLERKGVAFPKSQPVWIYSGLWNADDWATRGGLVKTDWSQAPFMASYRGFSAQFCVWSAARGSSCSSASVWKNSWLYQSLDTTATGQQRIKWVQMIYNYCIFLNRQ